MDPSKPPPTLQQFTEDFVPTPKDIDNIHGNRNEEEKKADEAAITKMATDELKPKNWSAPWFECKDLSIYTVKDPSKDFPRIARQYENIMDIWSKNYEFALKRKANPNMKLPTLARVDQAVNGDLDASNERRRKHLCALISYCWQLRTLIQDEERWKQQQSERMNALRIKKEKEKKKKKEEEKKKKKSKKKDEKEKEKTRKNKKDGGGDDDDKKDDQKEDAKEKEEDDEDIIDTEPNPYIWGTSSPQKIYSRLATALIGVYYLCLCGAVSYEETLSASYYQKKFDATHVFANHMSKLVHLTTADNKAMFQVIYNMICTGQTAAKFLFHQHLHNVINFESKHSSTSLRQKAERLENELKRIPGTSTKKLPKIAALANVVEEIKNCGQWNDQFIQMMKRKAAKYRPYPDHVYLRVFHQLGLTQNISILNDWGITQDDYNRIWRKIDENKYEESLRGIICNVVSVEAKKETIADVDAHKLGIGPDYVSAKYENLIKVYNEQQIKNKDSDQQIADVFVKNTDFLKHYGMTDKDQNDDIKLNEDEINTTEFAHRYLSGQTMKEQKDEKKQENDVVAAEEKKEEKIEKIEALPANNSSALRQILQKRKERLLNASGLNKEEVKKLLDLSDNRVLALSEKDFLTFYGNHPRELIDKFMDKSLNEKDKEWMRHYFKNLIDSYRKIQSEKLKMMDPAKHFGSLRSAVSSAHQSAVERIEHTKKKYTDEYFANVQKECDEFEEKLHKKQQNERRQRRERIEQIKKLERKKRQRLTNPMSEQEQTELITLHENESIVAANMETVRKNIKISQRNEAILDRFFDEQMQKNEEKPKKDVQSKENDYGMNAFLHRESNKNYGKMFADKQQQNIGAITQAIITKKLVRKKQESMQFNELQLEAINTEHSATPHLMPQNGNVQTMNEKLQKLLREITNRNDITNDMKMEAKALLHGDALSRSVSPNPPPSDEHLPVKEPQRHDRSGSMVIHDHEQFHLDDNEHHHHNEYSDDEDLKKQMADYEDIDHGLMTEDDGHEHIHGHEEDDNNDDQNDLPFDDIDIMNDDLAWLDTDELVPISQKDMLDANDISKLKVKEVPASDVIISDGLEQRERAEAVAKYEKSHMADAALKKAKNLEKEKLQMQKRLDDQKKEEQEIDILKQGGIIRQKKSADEHKQELAAMTEEEKKARRAARKQRNKYMKKGRNPQLLSSLDDKKIEEETVEVDMEIDDFELIPFEESMIGKELIESEEQMKQISNLQTDDIEISGDDDEDIDDVNVSDLRQQRVFDMSSNELYEYVSDKAGISKEECMKLIDNGINGKVIEIAINDNELNEILKDVGFAFTDIVRIIKHLHFDGWKVKESFPVTMNDENFHKWMVKNNKKMANELLLNGVNGAVIAQSIEQNDFVEIIKDAYNECKDDEIESLRSQFVIDSNMVRFWTEKDVSKWIKSKLKNSKKILSKFKGIDGKKLLSFLQTIPSTELNKIGIDQVTQSKIQGKLKGICRNLNKMDSIETMFWISSMNHEIAQTMYKKGINGSDLLKNKGNLSKICPNKEVCKEIQRVIDENGAFVPLHFIQDPNIVNNKQSNSKKKTLSAEEKAAKKLEKKRANQAKIRSAKRRHSRVSSKIELGGALVIVDGKKFMRVYKGKKKVKRPQKIKNYTKKTITLAQAMNPEQNKLRKGRLQKYEKRKLQKQADFAAASAKIDEILETGLDEANEMIGGPGMDDGFMTNSDDSDYTDSEEDLHSKIMITHSSTMSTSRIADRLDMVGPAQVMDDDNHLSVAGAAPMSSKKAPGRVTMAGHALADFVAGGDGKQLFHKRRASSLVQRIVAKSASDMENFKMRRKSRLSMSMAMGGAGQSGSGSGAHSRRFSSGHFVTEFFKSATDRQKIEAGMRGEAPLIIYYCDKDERTEEIKDIYQTSVLDTYIDDYSTFDDYIKILSMRLEHAQKKHRTEMDELRRHKEDLTLELQSLRTKKEELIRLIGQERSLFKRELPNLAKAKSAANAAQDQYENAESVIKEKFNETKLHVMMMMNFRDNHLQKVNEEKLKSANLKEKIHLLQTQIEELLSHYFTLQNAHNKLEHTVALLSELTTLCHEVNVRKKSEYEREIKDLLAMIERYRCRIRNVDKLIKQYEAEVIDLRMLHEERKNEFLKIQKNPTTNRTAATIDYYVAQRKLYEEKMEKQNLTYDDFRNVIAKYEKELSIKNSAFNEYKKRSMMATKRFRQVVDKKNSEYQQIRPLCTSLGISYKQAEKEFIERGNPLSQQFIKQFETMQNFEEKNKLKDIDIVEAKFDSHQPENETILKSFDAVLASKTFDQMNDEDALIDKGHFDQVKSDLIDPNLSNFSKIPSTSVMNDPDGSKNADAAVKTMAVLHRSNPDANMDQFRSPSTRNMDQHPENALTATFNDVDQLYAKNHGQAKINIAALDEQQLKELEAESDDSDDNEDDVPNQNTALLRSNTTKSVHFRDDY